MNLVKIHLVRNSVNATFFPVPKIALCEDLVCTIRKKYALKFSKLYWKLHNSLINYSATNSTNPYITTILLHTTYYCLLSIIDYYLSRRTKKMKRKKNLAVKKKNKALDHCFGKSLRQFLCEARSILQFPVQVTHFRLTISG